MPMTPKEMERLLLKNGFVFDRQTERLPQDFLERKNEKGGNSSNARKRPEKRYRTADTKGCGLEIIPASCHILYKEEIS